MNGEFLDGFAYGEPLHIKSLTSAELNESFFSRLSLDLMAIIVPHYAFSTCSTPYGNVYYSCKHPNLWIAGADSL